jgi:hypothetical protein
MLPSAIEKIPIPQHVSQLQSFPGLVGYYQKLIQNFAKLFKPLYDSTRLQVKYNTGYTIQ